jgi:iron(III) transport system substrate-binding protein
MRKFCLGLAGLAPGGAAAAQGQVNVICSVQAEWCNMLSTVYARTTGTRINVTMKGSGEALAQLIAEKENPKTDVWFGGTGDPHLQAAEQGSRWSTSRRRCLSCTRGRSSRPSSRITRRSASTPGPLGFGYNTELLARKKLPGAQDLGGPSRRPGLPGRGAGGQPGFQRNGLHDDRDRWCS